MATALPIEAAPTATGAPAAVAALHDLTVQGLAKAFGARPVLRGVDLAVPRGQAVARRLWRVDGA